MRRVKIGIIGGSGLDDPDILAGREQRIVSTEFGLPSDALVSGTIGDVPCVLLPRHGRNHGIMPTNVNYRANVAALKSAGCTHLLVTTACGSLKDELRPGDVVILDSFVDRTHKRKSTFFDGSSSSYKGVCHLPMEPAFCGRTRKVLIKCAEELGIRCHPVGTCVTVEGPRFSTKAESNIFRSWGCDVVNMTTVPEVVLAKEAGLCYAAVALVTDYDCWKDSVVRVDDVLEAFKKNVRKVVDLIVSAVKEIGKEDWSETIAALEEEVKRNTMLMH